MKLSARNVLKGKVAGIEPGAVTTIVKIDLGDGVGELVFRILFKGDGKRQPQVTVKLRPPGVVQFRRTQHEARVMKLIERNGLMNDRDDFEVVDAAE